MTPISACKAASLWCWAVSNDGVAVAQWVSAVFSLAAIVVAMILFAREQKRANGELLREQQREADAIARVQQERVARTTMLTTTIRMLLDQALFIVEQDRPQAGPALMFWKADEGKPLALRSVDVALQALTSAAAAENINLLMNIATFRSIIEATIRPVGMREATPVGSVLALLDRQSKALRKIGIDLG